MHILGYFVDHRSTPLLSLLGWARGERERRNFKILDRLKSMGMDVTMEELEEEAGGEVVGRPHMAKVLVKKGYVPTVREAFERFLGKGKPCYVDKERPSFGEAIRVIRGAGGIPVLAHPFSLNLEKEALRGLLEKMVASGLEGIEVYYPEHSPEDMEYFLFLAKEFDLVVTGGSDFHGEYKPDIDLGMLDIPFDIYRSLVRRWEEIHEAD